MGRPIVLFHAVQIAVLQQTVIYLFYFIFVKKTPQEGDGDKWVVDRRARYLRRKQDGYLPESSIFLLRNLRVWVV